MNETVDETARIGPVRFEDLPEDDDGLVIDAKGLECRCGNRTFVLLSAAHGQGALLAICATCRVTYRVMVETDAAEACR